MQYTLCIINWIRTGIYRDDHQPTKDYYTKPGIKHPYKGEARPARTEYKQDKDKRGKIYQLHHHNRKRSIYSVQ